MITLLPRFLMVDTVGKYLGKTTKPSQESDDEFWKNCFIYCPECIKHGYHSLLHQFYLINKCPFHLIELQQRCPKCNVAVPYKIPDSKQDPFKCKCGYSYLVNEKNPFWASWLFELEIKDKGTKIWLDTSILQREWIKNSIVINKVALNEPLSKEFLLSTINDLKTEFEIPYFYNHYSVFTCKYIHQLRSIPDNLFFIPDYNEREGRVEKDRNFVILNTNKFSPMHVELYESIRSTIKSIDRHLKKGILRNHKSCISRFVNLSKELGGEFPEICPYAYAYVLWKQSIYGIKYFYRVFKRR